MLCQAIVLYLASTAQLMEERTADLEPSADTRAKLSQRAKS